MPSASRAEVDGANRQFLVFIFGMAKTGQDIRGLDEDSPSYGPDRAPFARHSPLRATTSGRSITGSTLTAWSSSYRSDPGYTIHTCCRGRSRCTARILLVILGASWYLNSMPHRAPSACQTRSISAPVCVRQKYGWWIPRNRIACSNANPSHEAPSLGCASSCAGVAMVWSAWNRPLSRTYSFGAFTSRLPMFACHGGSKRIMNVPLKISR